MARNSSDQSHLSQGAAEKGQAPIRQHHRLAAGDKVDGKSNPNGAESADRAKKVKPSTY